MNRPRSSGKALAASLLFSSRAPLSLLRYSVLCAVPLVAAQTALAQTGTITGRVSNAATGDYLRNAVVRVVGTNIEVLSENGGNFRLIRVPVGEVKIAAEFSGLDTLEKTVTVTDDGTATVDFDLTSSDYKKTDTIVMGEFVVASQREGNAKAIQEQRQAVNIKTVIAADTFGDVSEGNVGEFLKLMPGVSMDYVEADTRAIRIRGMDPKYSVVMMDGAPIASAGSSSIGTGRSFEFEQLSIASIETIEMSKTPTPADNASAVAGVVNLRSKGAFDRKGRRIDYSLSFAGNEYYLDKAWERSPGIMDKGTRKIYPNASLNYSDVLLDGKLGVQMGAFYSYTLAAQKHIRFNNSGQGAYTWDSNPGNNDEEVPRINSINFRDGPKTTERKNYNIRLDYKINDYLWAWTRFDYNQYSAIFVNRDSVFSFGTITATAGNYSVTNIETTATGGSVNVNTGTNQKHGDTATATAAINFKKDALSIDNQVQFSQAYNFYDDLNRGFFTASTATLSNIGLRMTRSEPGSEAVTITQTSGADWRDMNNYTPGNLTSTPRASKDQKWTAKTDGRYVFATKLPITVRFGGAVNESIRNIDRWTNTYTYVGPDGVASTSDDNRLQPAFTDFYPAEYNFGGNVDGLGQPSVYAYGKQFKDHPEYFTTNPLTSLQSYLQNNYDFKEQVDAAYLQSIFKVTSKFDIAPGVRVERTRSWGRGVSDIGDAAARRALGLPTSGGNTATYEYVTTRYGSKRTSTVDYTDPFFYLHANYAFTKNLLLRGSFHQSITRPDLANLLPGVSGINEETRRFTVNNPNLKPEYSKNYNLSAEYYWEPASRFSVGIFYSDLKDIQRRTPVILGDDGYLGDTTFANWEANIWNNVSQSTRKGIEVDYIQQLSFLPGYLSGLGVFGNYTHVRFDDWGIYLNSPKDMRNAGISYRWRKFDARFTVNYTGRIMTAGPTASTTGATVPPTNGIYQWQDPRTMFDVQFNYKVSRNTSVFLTGRNIFDEPIRYYANKDYYPTRVAKFGGLWTAGIKGSF